MSVEVIHCPNCAHKLRLPIELLGETVQCPVCATQFVAPQRIDAPIPTVRAVEYEAVAPEPTNTRIGPGLGLLVVSLLGLAANTYSLAFALLNPEQIRAEAAANPLFAQNPDVDVVVATMVGSAFGLLISGVTGLGAWAMLFGRVYLLAVLGSVAAMINCPSACCVLGLPIGLWALFTLLQPTTQLEFQRRT